MAGSLTEEHSKNNGARNEVEEDEVYRRTSEEYEELLETLPRNPGWMVEHLLHYQGFWLTPKPALRGIKFLQTYKPRRDHVILSSFPKSGATWLRALIFSIMTRTQFDFSAHPLLTTNPHDCFPFLEAYVSRNNSISELNTSFSSQSLFGTHIPYCLLPESMRKSPLIKMVYVSRNPKDVFVSKFLFMCKIRPKDLHPLSLQEAFELFCDGISHYGSFWDHVLEYWKASIASPENVLFLKYEDLKKEPFLNVQRLAEFLGKPFTAAEEEEEAMGQIVKMCSFENLSKLEVNLSTELRKAKSGISNRDFFRRGEVGNGMTYLTVEMAERLDRITKDKFKDYGLIL